MNPNKLKNKLQELQQSLKEKEKEISALNNEIKYLNKYQFISNAAEDFMTLINRKYEYVAVNNSYCREHKMIKTKILGQKVYDVWGKEAFNHTLKDILKRCFKGETIHYQDWFQFENSKEGYYDVVYYPYYDENRKITHVAVVTRDITRLKTTELELIKSENKYRSLIEGSFDMIFRLDKNFIFTFVSRASERLFGILPDDLIGREFSEVFIHDELEEIEKVRDRLQRGNNVETIQLKLKTGEAGFSFTEINALPIYESEIIIGYQGIVRDLTQRKKMEEKQRQLESELIKEHRLASIGMLTSGLAHNIRTPLTSIMGAVQLIKMGNNDLDNLDIIYNSTKKIEFITESMMVSLRKEKDENIQEIDINDVLQNEINLLQSNLEFKHYVNKEINLAESIPTILGVYNNFSQAFANIIQNALDAMYDRKEKNLSISSQVIDSNILVEISDSGCGIEKENLDRLFDPFYTSKPKEREPGSKAPRGTGLGLYSCYNMLKPYNVKIDVDSRVNRGTTFKLYFPIKVNQ